MSAELVERLVGDLSAIRAPRGSELNARSWQTEAPLRMLLNNLDPEVAEHPQELVVYGGSGRAARSHEALRAIVTTLLRLRDDETLLVQSGKPVGRVPHPRGRSARPDRELPARPSLGELGRVPAARGRGADDVRPDDRRLVDLHRHPGDPAGHLPDLRRGGRGALRLRRSDGAHDPHRRPRWHGRCAAAGRDDGRRGDPLRRGRPALDRPSAGDALRRRAGSDRSTRRVARVRAAAAEGRPLSVAVLANAADVFPELVARGDPLRPRHRPDRRARPAHRLRPGRGAVRGGGRPPGARSRALPRGSPRSRS